MAEKSVMEEAVLDEGSCFGCVVIVLDLKVSLHERA